MNVTLILIALFFSVFLIALCAITVWRLPHNPFTFGFLGITLAAGAWSLFYALEIYLPGLSEKVLVSNVQFVAIAFLPLPWLLIVLRFTGHAEWIKPKLIAALLLIPCLTTLLVWTSPYHTLFRYDYFIQPPPLLPVLGYQNGFFYWVHAVYSYALLVFSQVFLLISLDRSRSVYFWQGLALFTSTSIPLVTDLIYNLGLPIFPSFNLTSILFCFSFSLNLIALNRVHLFDLAPIARKALVEILPEGILVLDSKKRVIDMNPAAEKVLGCNRKRSLGIDAAVVLLQWPELLLWLQTEPVGETDLPFCNGSKPLVFNVQITPLKGNYGLTVSSLVIFRDITERTILFQEVQRLATSDPLTELLNRRSFITLAENEFARSARTGRPLALILIDLDHFKQVNDQFGHLFGDEVLQATAQLFRANLRGMDLLCRYGGEEFLLLLPETGEQEARKLGERLRKSIEQKRFTCEDGFISITISLGIASIIPSPNQDLDSLIEEADLALYEAKRRGRNQVINFSSLIKV